MYRMWKKHTHIYTHMCTHTCVCIELSSWSSHGLLNWRCILIQEKVVPLILPLE